MGKVRIAVVGANFGSSFARIYKLHPDVEYVGLCDRDADRLQKKAAEVGIERTHADLREVLASSDYDAVHICLPVNNHAKPTLAVLESGKHCACAVPMATTIDDIRAIIAAQRKAGVNYMMMETVVYSKDFHFAQSLHERGEFGRIQFLRGAHYQDLEGFDVWSGFPPMHYATHAVSPLLRLMRSRAATVRCLGSGTMRDELVRRYGNPFPVETMIFQIEGSGVAAEVTRTLFETAVRFSEDFDVYGQKMSFHSRTETLVRMEIQPGSFSRIEAQQAQVPTREDLLPPAIAHFAAERVHGGSHPHLVHEFIRSIVEQRSPAIDPITAADWCAVGICAHESSLRGGEVVTVPTFA
jgi:predicted dehydrogenase